MLLILSFFPAKMYPQRDQDMIFSPSVHGLQFSEAFTTSYVGQDFWALQFKNTWIIQGLELVSEMVVQHVYICWLSGMARHGVYVC